MRAKTVIRLSRPPLAPAPSASPRSLRSARLVASALAVLVAAAPLGACSAVDDGKVTPGARREGNYPNLNIRPPVAAPQLSDAEAAAVASDLAARRNAIAEEAADAPESDAERLREIAGTHAKRTIDEIEGN